MLSTVEKIRLFIFPIVGAVLMFLIQPTLYESQVIRLTDVKVDRWLPNGYYPQATLVWSCSVIAALIWCLWSTISPPDGPNERSKRKVSWWMLSLLPLASVVASVIWSRKFSLGDAFGSDVATLSVIVMFSIDILLLYWGTTATTTPGNARNLPPGSSYLFKR